jgi:hypothetical protein
LSKSRGAASFGRGVRWWFCTLGRVEWSIALSVPLGFIVIFVIAIGPAMLGSGGTADDASWVARLAFTWIAGLAVQVAITQALFTFRRPYKPHLEGSPAVLAEHLDDIPLHPITLTIGGVWIAIPDLTFNGERRESLFEEDRQRGSFIEKFSGGSRVLALWSGLLLALGLGVLVCLLIDMATTPGVIAQTGAIAEKTLSVSNARTEQNAAVAAVARPWIAAGWILCLQGFWQLLPVPQSLGRVGWSTAIGLFAQHPDPGATERVQAQYAVRIVRWWLVACAAATLVLGTLAIHTSGISTQPGGRALPAFAGIALLALWLFLSTRNEDLFASQLTLAGNQETGVLKSRMGIRTVLHRWQTARRQREQTERLRAVAQRERAEANDAARADEILQRLHAEGPAALTNDERAILSRVSEAIRRQRAREDHNPHNP